MNCFYANKDIIKSKANVRGTDEGTAFDFNDADAMDSTAYNELKQVKAGGSKDLTFTYTDAMVKPQHPIRSRRLL